MQPDEPVIEDEDDDDDDDDDDDEDDDKDEHGEGDTFISCIMVLLCTDTCVQADTISFFFVHVRHILTAVEIIDTWHLGFFPRGHVCRYQLWVCRPCIY